MKRPMKMIYRMELDVSQVLNPKEAQEYQQFFGIAHCIVEIGRVDILYEVLLLSSHLSMPRKVHMEALMGMLVYLDKAYGETIIVYHIIPKVNTSMEIETNWLKSIYGKDNQKKTTANTPEPLGKPMLVNVFVYTNQPEENLIYRSHTGILNYVNNTPIDWFSKRQNTVETSTFGAELIAARIAMEKVKALRTKF